MYRYQVWIKHGGAPAHMIDAASHKRRGPYLTLFSKPGKKGFICEITGWVKYNRVAMSRYKKIQAKAASYKRQEARSAKVI